MGSSVSLVCGTCVWYDALIGARVARAEHICACLLTAGASKSVNKNVMQPCFLKECTCKPMICQSVPAEDQVLATEA